MSDLGIIDTVFYTMYSDDRHKNNGRIASLSVVMTLYVGFCALRYISSLSKQFVRYG